jgi:hypothetical protein
MDIGFRFFPSIEYNNFPEKGIPFLEDGKGGFVNPIRTKTSENEQERIVL